MDQASPKFDSLLSETYPSSIANEYWSFLSDLHYKVKDD